MLDRLQAVLNILTTSLRTPLGAATFRSRFQTQKLVYLLQAFGYAPVRSYRFGTYLRGPYCTELTKEYYALREAPVTPASVPPPEPRVLDALRQALREGDDFLEAATTMHRLHSIEGRGAPDLPARLREIKPLISDATARRALAYLQQHGLVPR